MKNSIGIDIGSYYTKVVEIESKSHKMTSSFLFKSPLLSVAANRNRLKEIDKKSFWQEIRKHIPEERLKNASFSIGLPNAFITILYFLLPRMPRNEIGQAVINEARRKMIPATTAEHTFEWMLLSEKGVSGSPKSEVLVLRTEKNHILDILNIFKEISSSPALISPFCLNAATLISEENRKKNSDIMHIDLGHSSINLSIFKEMKLVFHRNIAYGLQDFLQEASAQSGLISEQIENIIDKKGVPDTGFDFKNRAAAIEEIMRQKYAQNKTESPSGQLGVNELELRLLWQSYIDRSLHELRRSLAYYKELSGGRQVEFLYFSGGPSQIQNLVPAISKSVGGQCRVIDKFVPDPIFVNAASCALALLTKNKSASVNFLPIELQKKETAALKYTAWMVSALSLIFILGLLAVNAMISNHNLGISIEQVENKLKQNSLSVSRLNELTQKEIVLSRYASQIESITQEKRDILYLLKEISRVVSDDILIRKIFVIKDKDSSSQGYSMEIDALVSASYETAEKAIERFKKELEATGHLEILTVSSLKLEKIAATDEPDSPEHLTRVKDRDFTLSAKITQ